MATMQLRPMAMGEILDASFALLRRHAGVFFGVAIVCQGLPTGLSLYVQFNGGAPQLFWLYVELHVRSEEHTSELQSRSDLVCRLLLEKKKKRETIVIRLEDQQAELEAGLQDLWRGLVGLDHELLSQIVDCDACAGVAWSARSQRVSVR